MPKDSMTPRERWTAVLQRRVPDRVPMDYWATPEATDKLLRHMHCDYKTMLERLHIDKPLGVGGRYIGPPPPDGEDMWGLCRRCVEYPGGAYHEVVNAPLGDFETVEDIERSYRWPSPDDFDYSHLPDDVAGKEHLPIQGGGSEPFLLYKALRGECRALMDLIEKPEIVDYCLDKLFEIAYQSTLRIFETIPGKVLISYVAEDLGSQKGGLIYSPEHIRRFLLPRMRRIMNLVRQNGAYVFHHDDGSMRDILPDLIDTGIQVLNPVQWRCPGMEREGLKADFGDRLIFHGGVDNQQTLAFGSVDDVRQEVLDNYRMLGAGGGYILAPCHNIQSVSPPENVVAMYETGYELGGR